MAVAQRSQSRQHPQGGWQQDSEEGEGSKRGAPTPALGPGALEGPGGDGAEEDCAVVVPSREHIRVAVRARPLANLQRDASAWVINSKSNTLQLREQVALSSKAALAQGRIFRFNSVEGPDKTNEDLTAQHVHPLLQAAFKVRSGPRPSATCAPLCSCVWVCSEMQLQAALKLCVRAHTRCCLRAALRGVRAAAGGAHTITHTRMYTCARRALHVQGLLLVLHFNGSWITGLCQRASVHTGPL